MNVLRTEIHPKISMYHILLLQYSSIDITYPPTWPEKKKSLVGSYGTTIEGNPG